MIYTVDIFKVPVNVVVNAASSSLRHGGGVAKAIAHAAGSRLLQECAEAIDRRGLIPVGQNALTSGGKLCQWVIHSVGPDAITYGDDCAELVYTTVMNA